MRIEPYKEVLAAMLLLNQSRQDYYKSLLGLVNPYEVVRDGAKAVISTEIFADDGDLDGDGFSNVDEYDITISYSASMEAFVEGVSDPEVKGMHLSVGDGRTLALLGALLVAAFVVSMRGAAAR